MQTVDVVLAWKDEDYRSSLTPEQLALLPDNPAGIVELDDQLLDVTLGGSTERLFTLGCCHITFNGATCGGFSACSGICPA
jgi:mersacidin/lichenicidin family type 2 lantibiotic